QACGAISLAGALVLAATASATNDNCAMATAITGTGTFAFNNSAATTGTQGQMTPLCSHVGRDLWYTWTAPLSGLATLSTCGMTTIDSAVAVYNGSGCPAAVAI